MAIDKASEQVLCVQASAVRELMGGKPWFGRGSLPLDHYVKALGSATFHRRGECETDERLKQVIPYVVLRCGDRVYSYTRGVAGSEGRLHAKRSIGIGGHVNPKDGTAGLAVFTIRTAAYREFNEEVGTPGARAVRDNWFAGLVNDDEDAVGRVHLGIAFVYDLHTTDIEPKESALADGRWVTPAELWVTPNLETWSGIVVQNLFAEGGVL